MTTSAHFKTDPSLQLGFLHDHHNEQTDAPLFRVTKEWLKQHGTKGCGWNKAQVRALGIDYPPRSGWLQKIEGTSISMAQRNAFEAGGKSPAGVPAPSIGLRCALTLLGAHAKLASMRADAGNFAGWLADLLPRLDAGSTPERSLQVVGEIAERFASDVEAHCEARASETARLPPLLVDAGQSTLPVEPALPLDGSQVPRRLARALDAKPNDIMPTPPARQPQRFTRVLPTREERQRRAEEKHQRELAECRARSAERHREQRRQSIMRG